MATIGRPLTARIKQAPAETESLIDGMQVELENLSLGRRMAQTASPEGRVSCGLTAEIEQEQRIAVVERSLPPSLAPSSEHTLKREMWDDAAIGAAPGFCVQGG